jgi:hypothetical protein
MRSWSKYLHDFFLVDREIDDLKGEHHHTNERPDLRALEVSRELKTSRHFEGG